MPRVDVTKGRKPRPSTTSEAALQDASTSNQPEPPINNDKAEKANRRKSAHFGNIGVAPGDEPAEVSAGRAGQGKRIVSAVALGAAGKEGRRLGKRLSAVNPEMVGVSWEVRESKYEEWMKAAIDNKITVTNTWNFALIDYFHDMTLLRNGPDDQSINFQKASSTLDGCVKIWTSRVDSVATETGKLLSGLAGGTGEEPQDEGEEGGEDGDRPKTRKNTSHRSESTLAKSFTTLQVKKLDLEFSVDPLFKKTSADFDEGGAMGLLMNHLAVDGRMRVVFDAGDAVVEEEELEEELGPGMNAEVDLERLRPFMPAPDALQNLMISDTLSSFRFSSDPSAVPDLTSLLSLKDNWNDNDDGGMSDFGESVGGGGPVDFFGDDDFGGGGMGGGYDDNESAGGGDYDGGNMGGMVASGSGAVALGQPGEHLMPFDPKRGGGDLVMALAGREGDGDDDGMFDYFDKGFGKRGWAGVEHWKLRKVAKKDPASAATKKADRASGPAKTPFVLDFMSAATTASSSKILFAPASRTSIALPAHAQSATNRKRSSKETNDLADKYKRKRREKERQKEESANLLPDDMHFSSRQLVRLFMKPKFALRMRKKNQSARIENAEGEIDTTFWAEAAAERADGLGEPASPMPFESQFFADGDNDGDDDITDIGDFAFVDDALDEPSTPLPSGPGDMDGEDDNLWQGSQTQIKRARPENVTFAKRAKRVDVKRLKDDIWVGLKSLVPKPVDADGEMELDDPSDPETEMLTPVGEAKTFNNIITDLRRTYPKDKMSEISTSFCFICLLHLANEEGLTLEAARFDGLEGEDVGCQGVVELDMASLENEGPPQQKKRKGNGPAGDGIEKVVGELQALRVYKDPTAGRAA